MLVIVPRDQVAAYDSLAAEFDGVSGCCVIIDRRHGERRRVERARTTEERRTGDRRSGHLVPRQGFVVGLVR